MVESGEQGVKEANGRRWMNKKDEKKTMKANNSCW